MRKPLQILLAILTNAVLLVTAAPIRGAETEPKSNSAGHLATSFENVPAGRFDKLETPIGVWTPTAGIAMIDDERAKTGKCCLQLTGGEKTSVTLDLASDSDTTGQLTFWAERWTSRKPFSFRIEKNSGEGWREVFNGDEQIVVGPSFLSHITVPLGDSSIKQLRLTVTSPLGTGALIDDVKLAPAIPQRIVKIETVPFTLPALVGSKRVRF